MDIVVIMYYALLNWKLTFNPLHYKFNFHEQIFKIKQFIHCNNNETIF